MGTSNNTKIKACD